MYRSGRYGKEISGKMYMGVYTPMYTPICDKKRTALCCGYCDCMDLRNLMGLLGKQSLGKGDWREIKELLWVREKAVRPLRVMHGQRKK